MNIHKNARLTPHGRERLVLAIIGGNAGLADGLRKFAAGKGICLVGHELTKHSGEALRDGIMAAVMDQAPETQARRSLDLMLNRLGLLDTAVDRSPIRFITVTAENL